MTETLAPFGINVRGEPLTTLSLIYPIDPVNFIFKDEPVFLTATSALRTWGLVSPFSIVPVLVLHNA